MGLRLGIVTDLHHGRDTGKVRGPKALSLLSDIAGRMHGLELDAVIDLGDRLTDEDPVTDRQRLLELAREFKRLPYPRHHISGNHDLLPKADQEAILEATLSNHVVEKGGWTLVFLETSDGTPGGALTPATLTWLEETLGRTANPVVVFSHQPLHGQWMQGNPYFEEAYKEYACAKGADAARAIIEASGNVQLCISGHAHWFDERVVNRVRYVTLLGPTESHWTGGDASGAWAMLELNGSINLKVFGLQPQQKHWSVQAKLSA
jgi:3',5'-cyclic-AMP phosphodiesterase